RAGRGGTPGQGGSAKAAGTDRERDGDLGLCVPRAGSDDRGTGRRDLASPAGPAVGWSGAAGGRRGRGGYADRGPTPTPARGFSARTGTSGASRGGTRQS